MESKITKGIDYAILDDFVRIMKKINIYIWCNLRQIFDYLDFFVIKHKCKFEILIWKKTNGLPLFTHKYLNDKEYCLYFRKGGYCQPTSYNEAKTIYESPVNIKDKYLYGHPTIKPLEFIKRLIANSTKENEIVFDPFMGSGTTAVASKELNRNYLGFEINKDFCEIANNRVNGITQQDVKLKKLGVKNLFDLD